MSQPQANAYDEVPYGSYPFAQSHPDRLAAVATLLGLAPPPVANARVLELGCAAGGNIIPMAEAILNGSFVGIDFAQTQVAVGQKCIGELGLRNIDLKHLDILQAKRDLATFDYVISHGVFSWVSPEVQEKMLALCGELLSPNGLAYISYNTLPGWRMRGTIRDMMLFHTQQFDTPHQRAEQAMALLDFMAQSAGCEGNHYGNFLRSELETLRHKSEWYLLHDHLEEHNDPMYFRDFIGRAEKHGLRYVGEAEIPTMVPSHFPPAVRETLDKLSVDQVHLEQYMDFLRNRMFRQTILCRNTQQPNYQGAPERLAKLHIASPVRPASKSPSVRAGVEEVFTGAGGLRITSADGVVKAALILLAECWPRSLPFTKLRALAAERVRSAPVQDSSVVKRDTEILAQTFWRFYGTASTAVLHLSTEPFRGTNTPGERPVTRPLVRWQAERQEHVTNLYHDTVGLAEGQRRLLARLDGRHDRAALLRVMEEALARGELTVQERGEPVSNAARVRQLLEEALAQTLAEFARSALLLA